MSYSLDLEFKSLPVIIGLLPNERRNEQDIHVECKITEYRTYSAQIVDYGDLCELVIAILTIAKFKLLEEACKCICEALCCLFSEGSVHVRIVKPSAFAGKAIPAVSYRKAIDSSAKQMTQCSLVYNDLTINYDKNRFTLNKDECLTLINIKGIDTDV